MDNHIIIKQATIEELKDIIQIEQVCFPVAEAATEKEFKERFQAFGNCFLVAINQNKVIGFINGCTTHQPHLPDELYHDVSLHCDEGRYQTVFGLDVLPVYQHQGVAKQLLNSFIDLAKKRKKKGMILTCKDYLIPFYEKFGFVHQGVSLSQHGNATWNDMLLIFEEGEQTCY